MTNFNPQEQQSLMGLLSALQSGMSGSTGYSLLQNVLGQQQNRLAARDERVGSLIDMITNAAGSGQSYEAAQALAGAYSQGSNIPPRVEDAMGSLYPGATGSGGETFGGQNPLPAMQQGAPGALSPVYTGQAQDPMAGIQYAQAQVDLNNSMQSTAPDPASVAQIYSSHIMTNLQAGETIDSTIAGMLADPTLPSEVKQIFLMPEFRMAVEALVQQAQAQGQSAQTGVGLGPVIPGTGGLTGGAGVLTRARNIPGGFGSYYQR